MVELEPVLVDDPRDRLCIGEAAVGMAADVGQVEHPLFGIQGGDGGVAGGVVPVEHRAAVRSAQNGRRLRRGSGQQDSFGVGAHGVGHGLDPVPGLLGRPDGDGDMVGCQTDDVGAAPRGGCRRHLLEDHVEDRRGVEIEGSGPAVDRVR